MRKKKTNCMMVLEKRRVVRTFMRNHGNTKARNAAWALALALSLGAAGYVRKPVTREAFLAALDRQIEQPEPAPR